MLYSSSPLVVLKKQNISRQTGRRDAMKILLSSVLALLLFHKTEAAAEAGGEGAPNEPAGNFSNFYEIKDSTGIILARLDLTQGPFFVELVKTKNESGLVSYVTNEKGRQTHKFGRYNFTSARPTITATKSGVENNGTKLEITFDFTEDGDSSQAFNVKTAKLKMIVEWGVPVRM